MICRQVSTGSIGVNINHKWERVLIQVEEGNQQVRAALTVEEAESHIAEVQEQINRIKHRDIK